MKRSRLLIALSLLVLGGFCGQMTRAAEGLSEKLLPIIERHQGDVAVMVKHLESGESFEHDADEVMPTASLIKLAVMVEAYQQVESGKVSLSEVIPLRDDDKVQGSGILTSHFSSGLQLSLRDAVRLMIAYSDNTATNLVVDRIGLSSVAKGMESLKLPETKLHAKVFRGETSIFPDRSKKYGLGSTTARETVKLLELIHRREVVSQKACDDMLAHLRACQDKTMLVRLLPEGTKVAHKTGAVTAVRCDAGLIESEAGPIAICVLTRNNSDRRWADDDAGSLLIARLARDVFFHFNDQWKEPAAKAEPLQQGASGAQVELLQRALNRQLKPSPELTVDGEFGPATLAAVIKLQKEHKLTANGLVDETTWKALGPVSNEADPVPEPEKVNAEVQPKLPPDELDGQPFVTAKAWALGDARTGQLLWSSRETEPLDFASTTKMMTAFLVIRLAEKDPTVLDELVTFSKRADRTSGTTSGVTAGEKVPVKELLFGLMLPSGNDAAVAFAEHFGSRMARAENGHSKDKKSHGKNDPYVAFVAEMNRTASELGMADTRYKNPHGLTENGHVSSARDLLKLGWEATQRPLFREVIQTRQHGCQVVGPGGYRRNLKWKNTNELLDIEGYEGIKTGTTDAAGACLVSQATRGTDKLMLVVLGSASSKARYADSRNLFRWGWQQRVKPRGD